VQERPKPRRGREDVDEGDERPQDRPRSRGRREEEDVEEDDRPRRRRDEEDEGEEERRPRRSGGPKGKLPAHLGLRIPIIVVAILAGLLSGVLGFIGMQTRNENIEYIEKNQKEVELAKEIARLRNDKEAKEKLERVDIDVQKRERQAMYLMMAGFAISLAASAFVWLSRGSLAGILLLIAPIGPAVIAPITLVFTFLFIPPGIAAFFVWPRKGGGGKGKQRRRADRYERDDYDRDDADEEDGDDRVRRRRR
jgi:hypothetical protein